MEGLSDAEILFPGHALDVASPDGNQLPTKMEKNGKRDGGLSDEIDTGLRSRQ